MFRLLSVLILSLAVISHAYAKFSNSNPSQQNMREATGYHGNGILTWGLYEIFDLNDDGFDDLVFGVAVNDEKTNLHSQTEFVKPVIFFWDDNKKSYQIDYAVQDKLPKLHWPRRAVGSKNPITGEVELFVADHGLDGGHAPNCGAPNWHISFNGGKITSVTKPYNVNDYSHGLASADLNNDGRLDHIVINSPYIKRDKCGGGKYTNDSYMLLSKNKNEFERKKIDFKSKSFGKKPYFDAGNIMKIDGSFYFIGGRGYHHKTKPGLDIFEINLNGKFSPKQFIDAPKVMKRNPSYSEVVLDNSDTPAFFATLAETDMNWRGRYIQRLEWTGSKFIDVSEKVQQVNPQRQDGETMPDWCTLFSVFKWKGNDYLTCSSLTPFLQGRPKVYVRQGERIVPVDNSRGNATFDEWTNREVNPVNHDGKTKLVAWDLRSGTNLSVKEAWSGIVINVLNYAPVKVQEYVLNKDGFSVNPQNPLSFPNEFVRRNVWDNEVLDIGQEKENLIGLIRATTILKHGSPVDLLTYAYSIPPTVKAGKIAFIDAITNNGDINTRGNDVSYEVQKKTANLVEKKCGVKLLSQKGKFYPTFPIVDALKVSFERRGFNLEVLSADSKCIINALNTQYPEYWYELLHITGKSIRGSNENGNIGRSPKFIDAFEQTQNTVKSNWRK